MAQSLKWYASTAVAVGSLYAAGHFLSEVRTIDRLYTATKASQPYAMVSHLHETSSNLKKNASHIDVSYDLVAHMQRPSATDLSARSMNLDLASRLDTIAESIMPQTEVAKVDTHLAELKANQPKYALRFTATALLAFLTGAYSIFTIQKKAESKESYKFSEA